PAASMSGSPARRGTPRPPATRSGNGPDRDLASRPKGEATARVRAARVKEWGFCPWIAPSTTRRQRACPVVRAHEVNRRIDGDGERTAPVPPYRRRHASLPVPLRRHLDDPRTPRRAGLPRGDQG